MSGVEGAIWMLVVVNRLCCILCSTYELYDLCRKQEIVISGCCYGSEILATRKSAPNGCPDLSCLNLDVEQCLLRRSRVRVLMVNMFLNDVRLLLRLYLHLQFFRLRPFPDPPIINEHCNSVRVLLLQPLVPICLIHPLHVR